MPPVDFDVYLITDRHRCGRGDLLGCVEQALAGGVRGVQLREKDLSTRERFELGTELRRLTDAFHAALFVNGDAALALALRADGVHLPQDGMPADVCRRLLTPEMLLGVSTHSLSEAREAQRMGADFITFGPVYETPSKANYGPPVGVEALRAVCTEIELPVFALGGVKTSHLDEILSAGAAGVAMISAVLAAADVKRAASDFVNRLRKDASFPRQAKKEG